MIFGSLGRREKSVEKIAKLNSKKVGHIFAPKKGKSMWQMVTYRRQFLKPASRGSCALNFPPAPQREEEEGEKMCAKVTAPPPLSFPLFRHSLDPFSGTS